MCRAIRYLDPALVRWVDDQQQEGGGSGGGDTLIMLCNHMDTTLTLYTPPTITTSYNYLSSNLNLSPVSAGGPIDQLNTLTKHNKYKYP